MTLDIDGFYLIGGLSLFVSSMVRCYCYCSDYVAIIIPNTVNPSFSSNGVLYMTGGSQDPTPPKLTSEDLLIGAIIAETTQTIVTVLFQIPNAPIKFWNEKPTPRNRNEDAILAYAVGTNKNKKTKIHASMVQCLFLFLFSY